MAKFNLSEYDHDQLVGLDFETIDSGYLEIPLDNANNNSISIPFLGHRSYAHPSTSFNYWDQFDLTVRESLDELRFIQLRLNEDPAYSYFLVVPDLNIDPFILLDGASIDLDGYDIVDEEWGFDLLLKAKFQEFDIVEAELEISDMVEDVNQTVAVPEPSSAFGVLVFGVVFLGVFLKRSLSRLAK